MILTPTELFMLDADVIPSTRGYRGDEPEPEPIEVASSSTRHVLVVHPSGAHRLEHDHEIPHHGAPVLGRPRCYAIAYALVDFEQGVAPAPGRYWCDVDDDGNFATGGRIPEAVTS